MEQRNREPGTGNREQGTANSERQTAKAVLKIF